MASSRALARRASSGKACRVITRPAPNQELSTLEMSWPVRGLPSMEVPPGPLMASPVQVSYHSSSGTSRMNWRMRKTPNGAPAGKAELGQRIAEHGAEHQVGDGDRDGDHASSTPVSSALLERRRAGPRPT